MRTRHFAIEGGICVNEWVDSCEVECEYESGDGHSASVKKTVAGYESPLTATPDAEVPLVSITTCPCTCPCETV